MNEKLITKYPLDLPFDPGKYRPMYYPVTLDVAVAEGAQATESVKIDNVPFVCKLITHGIISPPKIEEIPLPADIPPVPIIFQDGAYLIEFHDEHTTYQSAPIAADLLFGSVWIGTVLPLAVPLVFRGSKTVTFRVTNLYNRDLLYDEFFKIQIVMHGVQEWQPGNK